MSIRGLQGELETDNVAQRTETMAQACNLSASGNRKDQAENILKQLNQAVDAINPDSVAEIVHQIQVVAKDQRASDDAATVFGDIARIDGVASESWKKMWEAARQFSEKEAYKSAIFPNVGNDARCVLCNQPLDDEARKRLISFEEFVKGAVSSELAESKKNLDSLIAGLALVPEDKLLEAMLVAAGIPDLLQENLRAAKKVLESHLSIVKDLPNKDVSKTVVPPLPASVIEPLRQLGQYIEGLNSQIETLTNKISPEDREKNVKEANELSPEVGSTAGCSHRF